MAHLFTIGFCFIFCVRFQCIFFVHDLNCPYASFGIISLTSWTSVFAFPKLKSGWDGCFVIESSAMNHMLGHILYVSQLCRCQCLQKLSQHHVYHLITVTWLILWTIMRTFELTVCAVLFNFFWLIVFCSACEDPACAGAGGTGAGADTVPGPVFH